MKKYLKFTLLSCFILAMSFIISGCLSTGTKYFNVKYDSNNLPRSTVSGNREVYLQVDDNRLAPSVIGQAAFDRNMFANHSDSLVNLAILKGKQSSAKFQAIPITKLVEESAKNQLQNLGYVVVPNHAQGIPNVVISITAFQVNIENNELQAQVTLTANIFKDQKKLFKTGGEATGSRPKLVGGMGVDKAISSAYESALKTIDFSYIEQL